MDRDETPIAGVRITILNHPEFGQTLTRTDGMFDLAVNGGGYLTVNYVKEGFLPAQRQLNVSWQDWALAPDVILIPVDPQATLVNLGGSGPAQVARGSVVTDDDGTRQATLLLPQGVTAQMVLPGGSQLPLGSVHVRATEYTVGPNGPKAMPAELPPTSGYTYAVELTVDEALALGAKSVQFDRDFPFYLENFLGFPVGTQVPVGIYDKEKAAWIPSPDGRVVKVLSVNSGGADIDTDGDGAADNGWTEFPLTDAERENVGNLYAAGETLWRVPLRYFNDPDLNWPVIAAPGSTAPTVAPEPNNFQHPQSQQCSSIIGCEGQTLGEMVPVAGTPFQLHYQSERTLGYRAAYRLQIPVTGGPDLLPELLGWELTVTAAGRTLFRGSGAPTANQEVTVEWDGYDAFGRYV